MLLRRGAGDESAFGLLAEDEVQDRPSAGVDRIRKDTVEIYNIICANYFAVC